MMILLPGMFVIIFSEPVYRWITHPSHAIAVKEQMVLDSLVSSLAFESEAPTHTNMRFKFDPNTADLNSLISLGIPETVGKRIIQYRNRGGEFRVKSDFAKIYGLEESLFKALSPYLNLPDKIVIEPDQPLKKEEPKFVIQLDINLTDTSSLQSVKGIGTVLSKRIIKYRESLGGFITTDQLKEVYGIDSAVFVSLASFYVAENFEPRKININAVSEKDLSNHPYISSRVAKTIVTFRMQHGQFQQLSDLLKIKTLKESDVARFGHYLSFE